ncbi:MAG: DUF1640 domain-containing protein [Candidatus Latescibacterota bacterium]
MGIDTLSIFERLKAADLSEKASREIAEVLKDVAETNLVTKYDLELALEKQKSDLVKRVAGLLIAQAAVVVAMVTVVLKIMLP